MAMSIRSTAFEDGGEVPQIHTCEGEDTSPALAWSGVPAGAKSLALIVDDPDGHLVEFTFGQPIGGL